MRLIYSNHPTRALKSITVNQNKNMRFRYEKNVNGVIAKTRVMTLEEFKSQGFYLSKLHPDENNFQGFRKSSRD